MSNFIKRAKNFIRRVQEVLRLTAKVSELVGDGIDVIALVDSVVDSFVALRKNGKLKDADFFEFTSAICDLIVKVAETGRPLGDVIVDILDLFDSSEKLQAYSTTPRGGIESIVKLVDYTCQATEEHLAEQDA